MSILLSIPLVLTHYVVRTVLKAATQCQGTIINLVFASESDKAVSLLICGCATLDNLEDEICVADDVLVYCRKPEEHEEHLEDFLERCLQQSMSQRRKIRLPCHHCSFPWTHPNE